jgi:hypothetical protein
MCDVRVPAVEAQALMQQPSSRLHLGMGSLFSLFDTKATS